MFKKKKSLKKKNSFCEVERFIIIIRKRTKLKMMKQKLRKEIVVR